MTLTANPARRPPAEAIGHTSGQVTQWLVRRSTDILRTSVGLVFLGFGALKFFPGVSPAQDLAVRTLEKLSLGVLSGETARSPPASPNASSGSPSSAGS